MTKILPVRLAALALLAPLAACAVGPDYRSPSAATLKVPEAFPSQPADAPAAADLSTWWRNFDDPVLSGLVGRALANNLDVATAGARLAQARANLRAAQGAQLPTAAVSGSISRSVGRDSNSFVDPSNGVVISSGGDTTVFQGTANVAWEADVFGRLRRGVEAARATLEQAGENLHFAQLSVAAEVGSSYLDARQAQQRLIIARNNLASQDETVQIVGWRVQAGLVSSLDLEQARQLRAQTAAGVGTQESAYTNAINRLAVLIGEAPGAVNTLMADNAPIPVPGDAAPAAIPADTIERRPDVRAAERGLAAEVARIGVATADLYPALRLTGSFTGSGTTLSDAASQAFGNLVGAISAPIFQGGQIRARINAQRAVADTAFATYRSTVLTAIEEVDDAYAALAASEKRETALAQADEAARNATLYARSQYRAGLIDFQSLLESERSLLSSQDGRATARADRARAYVQLYRALGGGWQSAPAPAPAGPYIVTPLIETAQ
ncbi:efflux transporter outer membrane subunit [Sphingomonas quercus]|uniref:Efflux transporter outer membrane subunit n=1 Tax=Sphingomonas quercus TaxID=2842451 RepID=A0ABS6BMT9_9SPHN|nr:efflux transporter outer membrane subunit [Sphingomonas quercus]MBU3078520.1 efflux transporter outer membrane subunit [Sphingomonas quercus]